jgi:hypothetical protein
MGNDKSEVSRKARMAASLSIKFTASISNSLSLNLLYKDSIEGIPALQGPHHEAQNFRKTTWPLR